MPRVKFTAWYTNTVSFVSKTNAPSEQDANAVNACGERCVASTIFACLVMLSMEVVPELLHSGKANEVRIEKRRMLS